MRTNEYGTTVAGGDTTRERNIMRAYKVLTSFVAVDDPSPELVLKFREWLLMDAQSDERWCAVEMLFGAVLAAETDDLAPATEVSETYRRFILEVAGLSA